MLSKTMALLLGILQKQPCNAYEINKQLSVLHVRDWCAVAPSTVYATLKAAEKKAYICGNIEKSGNMPDKTMFSLSEIGRSELETTLDAYLQNFDYDITAFNIGIFFADDFPAGKLQQLLSARAAILEKYAAGLAVQIEKMEKAGLPPRYVANVKQNLYIVHAQQQGTAELLKTC